MDKGSTFDPFSLGDLQALLAMLRRAAVTEFTHPCGLAMKLSPDTIPDLPPAKAEEGEF